MKEKDRKGVLKVKLSKVSFPEVCPACLEEAEDLVSMQVWSADSDSSGDFASTTFSGGSDRIESAMMAKKGATVIWVPTCMSHGSKNVRTTSKVVLSWIGFLVLWYPGIYFLLGVLGALYFNRSFLEPLLQLFAMFVLMAIVLMYGYFPRAVERNLRFLDVDVANDALFIHIGKEEYYKLFYELNEMHIEEIEDIDL